MKTAHRLYEYLRRQHAGLKVLWQLLEEEFSLLRTGKPELIAPTEFSIQELLRQLALEKESLRRFLKTHFPKSRGVRAVISSFPPEQAQILLRVTEQIQKKEQDCARQAAMNADLARALQKQSAELLEFFRRQVTPKVKNTYSARGRMYASTPTPSLFSGRY